MGNAWYIMICAKMSKGTFANLKGPVGDLGVTKELGLLAGVVFICLSRVVSIYSTTMNQSRTYTYDRIVPNKDTEKTSYIQLG